MLDHAEQVRLGRSGLTVTRLGVGTAWLGNLYERVDDTMATAVLLRALEVGIRLFDTAPLYGLGLAEQRIGWALRQRPRREFVVSTKVGRLLRARTPDDPELLDNGRQLFVDAPALYPVFDFSYDAALRSVEQSLRRLAMDRVDIVFIHDPDDQFAEALDGAYPALERMRAEGVIRAIGVGMNHAAPLVEFARSGDFDCFLLAGRYTLLDQSGLPELLPLCASRGISLVIGGVYNTGFLADPKPGGTYNFRPVPAALLERAVRIRAVCGRYGVPLKAAAIQFPFGHPAVSTTLTGVRSVVELDENVRMLQLPIPGDLWKELAAEGLLPVDVPLPVEGDKA